MRLYFERLRPWHLPLVLVARLCGVKLGAFDPDLRLRQAPLVGRLVRSGHVARLVTWSWGTSHSDGITWANRIVDTQRDHLAARAMIGLYGDDEARLVFKRCLAERLSQSFEIGERFRRDISLGHMEPTWLVASRLASDQRMLRRHGYSGRVLPEGVRLIALPGLLRPVQRLATLSAVLASVAVRLLLQARHGSAPPPRCFSIGWSISTIFQTRFSGPRRFDFIVDGKVVHNEDVVYLLELPLPAGKLTEIASTGRNLADVSGVGSIGFFWRSNVSGPWVSQALRALPSALLHGWRSDHLLEGTRACLAAWLYWHAVLARVRFGRYVTTNNESRAQIAANVIMRRAGIETVAYSQFIGGPYQLAPPFDDRNVLWSFMNYDVHTINNVAMRDSFRAHGQSVRRYELIGNVFAEMIEARRRAQSAASAAERARTVAVFDTTFVDEPGFFTSYEDCELLMADLIRLAQARPDLRFRFKPAKPDSYFVSTAAAWASPLSGARISRLRAEYVACANVEVLSHEDDPVDVIAACGLAITHCFSSPTADALAAGVPAVWYASTRKLADYPLAGLNGSAVFGYDALAERLDGLLAGRGCCWHDPRYREMIEPYADRRALSRLSRLLSEREPEPDMAAGRSCALAVDTSATEPRGNTK